jgi:Flp pilus assembly protein TadB
VTAAAVAVATIGWLLGRPLSEMLVLAGATLAPVPTLAVTAALVLHSSRRSGSRRRRSPDALFLVRLAADLRSGESLRWAVAGAAEVDPRFAGAARLATSGRPLTEVARELGDRLDRFGPEVGGSLRLSAAAGGSAAAALEELAAQVLALDDLERERRSAMAPAVLQACILGGLGIVAVLWTAASGRLVAVLAGGGIPAASAVAGLCAVAAGVVTVIRMVRR